MLLELSVFIASNSTLLIVQGIFSMKLMLYSWETAERTVQSGPPAKLAPPRHSFSVLLPARAEERVIYQTIRSVWQASYPRDLLEIIVICHMDDTPTIHEAKRAIRDLGSPSIQVVTYGEPPLNKPHGLNVGLSHSVNEIVTIFDSEDDIAPEIFSVVNTLFVEESARVVQGGVQLMNFRDHWFAAHNCLEYFFWFKSRLHFQAARNMIPLGGNTVFFHRALLEQLDGWNENCLTEDAEMGLRLSMLNEPIRVFYSARYATREETPKTVGEFIRQRTRWHQGFLQILRGGGWRRLPTARQRALALYCFIFPWFQAMLLVLFPLELLLGFLIVLPVGIALLSFAPLYVFALQAFLEVFGLIAFTRDYHLRFSLKDVVILLLTFLPYQFLQGVSALRAIGREFTGRREWEKTLHVGAHRR